MGKVFNKVIQRQAKASVPKKSLMNPDEICYNMPEDYDLFEVWMKKKKKKREGKLKSKVTKRFLPKFSSLFSN